MSSSSYIAQKNLGDWRRWREVLNPNSVENFNILDLNPGLQTLTEEFTQANLTPIIERGTRQFEQARLEVNNILSQLKSLKVDFLTGVDADFTNIGNIADEMNSISRQLLSTVSNAEVEIGPTLLNRSLEELSNSRSQLLSAIGKLTGDNTAEITSLINTIEQLVNQDSALGSVKVISEVVSKYLASGPNQILREFTNAANIFEKYASTGEIGSQLLAKAPDLLSGVMRNFDFGLENILPKSFDPLQGIFSSIIGPKLGNVSNIVSGLPNLIKSLFEEVVSDFPINREGTVNPGLFTNSPRQTDSKPLQPYASKYSTAVQVGGKEIIQSYGNPESFSYRKGFGPYSKMATIPEIYADIVNGNARLSTFPDTTTIDSFTRGFSSKTSDKLLDWNNLAIKGYSAEAIHRIQEVNGPGLTPAEGIKTSVSKNNPVRTNGVLFRPTIRRKTL